MDKNITIENKFLEDKMRFDKKYLVKESNSSIEYDEETSEDITQNIAEITDKNQQQIMTKNLKMLQ